MKLLLVLSWKAMVRNRRFSSLFVACLTLGLAGFLLVCSFAFSFSAHIDKHLKEILTADLVIRTTQPLTTREQTQIQTIAGRDVDFSRQISFYTMLRSAQEAKLTRIIAIDGAYPLYGHFSYQQQEDEATVRHQLQTSPSVLLSGETAQALRVHRGDSVQIGKQAFALQTLYRKAPGGEFTSVDLAPTVYIGLSQVQQTGLLQFGSRVRYSYFLRLPDSAQPASLAQQLQAALPLQEKGIRVQTSQEFNQRLDRGIGFFRTFIGLAEVISLFLSGIAAAYLFRENVQARRRMMAILLSLGATRLQALLLIVGELMVLGVVAGLCAIGLGNMTLPFFIDLFAGLLPTNFHATIDFSSSVMTLVVGGIAGLCFCFPSLTQLIAVRPVTLFHQTPEPQPVVVPHWRTGLSLFPGLVFLLVLASILAQSARIGLWFSSGLLLLFFLFMGCGRLVLYLIRLGGEHASVNVRLVIRNLYRTRGSVVIVFASLSLALLMTGIIPQLKQGLVTEIAPQPEQHRPVYFLIDIQEHQLEPLQNLLQHLAVQSSPPAPMVRGRIVSINDIPFATWRAQLQQAGKDMSRRLEFNFSFKKELGDSEAVIDGPALPSHPWDWQSGKPFALSLEQQFSERMGLDLGDTIRIDIQGIELDGQVLNKRKVRWNSFHPNFFMLTQQGVLDEAPKTYLATVSAVTPARKPVVVRQLADHFPNISVLDVSETVGQLQGIAAKLSHGLQALSWLALASGLAVFGAIVYQESLRREKEINLLKILGAGRSRIRWLLVLEFSWLGAAAAGMGLMMTYVVSWLVAWWLFDSVWQFQWDVSLRLLVGALLISVGLAIVAGERVIRQRPVILLH